MSWPPTPRTGLTTGTSPANVYLGCAGWTIPAAQTHAFAAGPSHLARYATRLPAVEINSSFYRPHRPATYGRWAATVAPGFQFAVKVPQTVTHTRRLVDPAAVLDPFLAECGALGSALGPLLVQLPPSLAFDACVVAAFLTLFRARFGGALVCEPRHASWFTAEADGLLATFQVARVAADPAVVPAAAQPGGWAGLAYYRLHGSPRIYYSAYDPATLTTLAATLHATALARPVWCIFDNTAAGAAQANALTVLAQLQAY
ncbi:MAG: DUF72 domain-containing protein [Chloroflexota bacterium]|nr:DUF72 domain-containing protein [Chloroflexota bacterium]